MGTTAEKLAYLNDTKTAIKDAIVAKGVEVPEGTTFREYAEKIGEIITNVWKSYPNGTSWTKGLDTTDPFQCLKYANGVWLTGGEKGLARSTDGKTWTRPVLNDWINRLCYGKGVWVAGGDVGVYYSVDNGVTWTKSSSPQGYIVKYLFYFDSGLFFNYGDEGVVYYSLDGMNWSKTNVTYSDSYWDIISIQYVNGIHFLYCVLEGKQGLYYSENGQTWTRSNVTVGRPVYGVIHYYNGVFILPIFDSTDPGHSVNQGIYISYDGKNWEKAVINFESQSSNSTAGFMDVFVGGDILLATTNYETGIYYSVDGKTWDRAPFYPNALIRCVVYHNGIYTAYVSKRGFYYSTDGKNWTLSTTSDNDDMTIKYYSGVWLAFVNWDCRDRSMTVDDYLTYYSIDGINWKVMPDLRGYLWFEHANNIWVSVNANDTTITPKGIYYSVTWESTGDA